DLLLSTSTTTTTPSSAGISDATRTSCDRPQASVTEASLSTTMLRMPLTMSVLPGLAGARVEHARERDDAGEPERISRGPLARGLAIYAAGSGHERERRLDAFDEHRTGVQQQVHLAGDAELRGQQ